MTLHAGEPAAGGPGDKHRLMIGGAMQRDARAAASCRERRRAGPVSCSAAEFLDEVDDDPQGLMARWTGNYKHGNERMAKQHPPNRH